MDFFKKTKIIKLLSNHGKYLVASDDGSTVRQSRRPSEKSHWLIETVDYKPNSIRIKNTLHEKYLTASNASFLLGMTGNKVLLTTPDNSRDPAIEWEPIKEGLYLKLRAFGGTFLRANGGTPPWRGSVTHDSPATESTRGWVLWGVEAAEGGDMLNRYLSTASSFSSDGSEVGSPMHSFGNSPRSSIKKTGMDNFHNAKAVRLQSPHMKYLYAKDDEESITQDKEGSSRNARWTVEFIDGADDLVRLKSCYGKYLAASDHPFLLGMTGRKVIQSNANSHRDSSIEWEPIREGNQVKLKTRYGNYLRANGGLPPWRNSVTHDVPHRSSTKDWILWEIHVVEIIIRSPEDNKPKQDSLPITPSGSAPFVKSSSSVHSPKPTRFAKQESSVSTVSSPSKPEDGRVIYYYIANENGQVDKGAKKLCINFEGNKVNELIRRLERETGIEDLIVCSQSPYNQKLYPIRLQLPPKNDDMHLVVVDPSSQLARDLEKAGLL